MRTMVSRPALRWLVPAGLAVAILGGGAATTAIRAAADDNLPSRTVQQLLVDLQSARLDAGSGTVIEHADFGLPALPDGVGGDGSAQFDSLIVGAHTLRVWYDGPTSTRIALVGALGESDVTHSGSDLWIWSSADNTATHMTVPPIPTGIAPTSLPSAITPSAVATDILSALTPTTSITSGSSTTIAGRPSYELVIAPKDTASLVASVHIAIDADRHIPLQVQIYAKGTAKPAFEIGYSQISFAKPDPSVFAFNPPPGVKIKQAATPSGVAQSDGTKPGHPALLGSGWSAVLSGPMPFTDNGPGGQGDKTIDAIAKRLPTVSGSWGSGKLLKTKLFTALLVNDGRVYIGAVNSQALIATVAAAAK